MNNNQTVGYTRTALSHRVLFISVLLLLISTSVWAQDSSSNPLDGFTPAGLQPGSPTGSFPLSGFDNINPYNGNLNFSLPLLRAGGRGGAGYTLQQPINAKWTVTYSAIDSGHGLYEFWDPGSGGPFNTPYSPGSLTARLANNGSRACYDMYNETVWFPTQSLTRMTFIGADGTEYEFRDQILQGAPGNVPYCPTSSTVNRGRIFTTADGKSATFISDDDIYDSITAGSPAQFGPSGYLKWKDGTVYRIDEGNVTWIRDRNGNKLSFTYTSYLLTSITDSLNRQITIEYNVTDPTYGLCNRIRYKGFGGAQRTILITLGSMSSALRSGYSIQTIGGLFPEFRNSSTYQSNNPIVPTGVRLPNGQNYKFYYNSYGEIARVELPTGGAYEYDWGAGLTGGPASGATCYSCQPSEIYRRVLERRVYSSGGTGASYDSRMTLSRPETYGTWPVANVGYVSVNQYKPNGNLLTAENHYYYGGAFASMLYANDPTHYSPWEEGREYQTDILADNGTTILRRVNNSWIQRTHVSWWTQDSYNEPSADPVINATSTTLVDSNQVSLTSFSYDQFNNQTDISEYDYAGSILRHTHTDFLTTNPVNSVDYTSTNIHIRSLPTQQSIYDSSGVERARTTYEYDNYASDTYHAPLTDRPSISGLDAAFTTSYGTRGNATRISHWLLSSGTSFNNYAQYDVAGNAVKAIDGRGFITTFDLSDRFGVPDGEARSNTGPLELSSQGQSSFAFVTSATKAGQTAYLKFDYYLGRPVDGEDPNGVVTSVYSDVNEALDRPTQVIRASNQGTGIKSQSTFAYDDVNHIVTTTTDQNYYGDNTLVSKAIYDGLGRTTEKRQYEGGTNYIVVQTQYDALGRDYKTSNPFRPWQSESPLWTTTGFDALSRVISVTTPDNAAIGTAYDGNRVLVTDQSGKQRISKSNALGQVKDVWEVTAADSSTESIAFPAHTEVTAGYHTSYNYDVFGNLSVVNQGSQTRYFMYDSLGRLIRARMPEQNTNASLSLSDSVSGNSQWCLGYDYDANGNVMQKTDARGVTTTFDPYDALNRPTVRRYSDGTPTVTCGYDAVGVANSKGRLTSISTSVSTYNYTNYDAMGRIKAGNQTLGNQTYLIGYDYDLAGHIKSQTYPSGHAVNYNYDNAGRLGDKDASNLAFTGNLGVGGASRTYSTGIVYSSLGGVAKEQFGTTTPIYNKLFYNSRGQMSEIRESTSYTGPADTNFNRGALINDYSLQCGGASCNATDNNGNLRKQTVSIPNNDQNTNPTSWYEQYDYDPLNRLQRVHEYTGNTQLDWQQTFTYDRFGNRTIDYNNTSSNIPRTQFSVNPANNQLGVPSGQSGTMSYDNAGNLTTDIYSAAAVTRLYDAENRMTSETQSNSYVAGSYSYDADGHRVKRLVGTTETWLVYGFGGELLAEYPANGAPANPRKEYGYRNGQLLITADAGSAGSSTAGGGGGSQNVSWTNAVGVTVSGNNLTSTGNGWNTSGAVSTQSISSGDGYVEFTASETTSYRMIGLSHGDTNQNFDDIDFAFYLAYGGQLNIFQGGVLVGDFGSYVTGDVLRVAVEGGVVKYRKNGTLVYTSTNTPNYPLLVDTSLYSNGGTLTSVVISGASGGGGGGGNGTQNASWTNAVGVTVSGNNLTSTGNGWGTAGAVSTQSIASGDGYIELTAGETTSYRMIGLSHGDTNQNFDDIDFAFYLAYGGQLNIFQGGVLVGDFGSYVTGDVLRVAVESGVVKYRKNGTLLYASTVAPTYPLLVDTSLYSNGSTLTNVVISGASGGGGGGGNGTQNASWTNAVGVTVSGNNLTSTGNGWGTAGAVSTQSIASGDGYVEFTASETTSYRMIGLSHGDTNQNFSDIDFAFYLEYGGYLNIYEGGGPVGNFGSFVTGDVLRVAVEGGVVKYRKNGTLVYISTITPTFPLLVDTSLYSNGATLTNVVINGAAAGGGGSSSAQTHWLVSDQLGTPRMIFDQSGSLTVTDQNGNYVSGMTRHDYLPFGEELLANTGGRTTTQGYTAPGYNTLDGARQKFTSYERDNETGLDYAHARYYANIQGRFSGVDPVGGKVGNPQSLNRYSYVGNNPLAFSDPSGMNYFYGTGANDGDPTYEDRTREHETESALAAYNEQVKDTPDDFAAARSQPDKNVESALQKSDIGEIHAGDATWVIIWTGTSSWNPIFKFGHISYIIGGQSYSWEHYTDPKTGKEQWRIDRADDYIKEKEAAGAIGVAYLLDFGSARANKRFRNDLIRAGNGTYDLFNNNCTYPFRSAINAEHLRGIPKNEIIMPSSQEQFIKDYLVPRHIVIAKLPL